MRRARQERLTGSPASSNQAVEAWEGNSSSVPFPLCQLRLSEIPRTVIQRTQ